MSDEDHLPKPGEVLAGKYRIERIIGKGGMGAVLAAQHELLGQRIAIKFLLGEIAQNQEAVTRFNNEARNAFKIQSEHVCRVMDVGNERGMPFMVMEFLEGQDLSQLLESRGALPVEEAVDYVLQGLEAIAQAHALGIVHRDLKPANLFLHRRTDGSTIVKVLDFGIAKASNPFGDPGGNHSLTSTKSMLGSPLYMSPEQLRSAKNVDQRADVWAVGVILYELLTATVPFNGETLGELFISILEQPPVPVSQKRNDVPQLLSDAIMRCLCRSVDQRFANVAELAQALAPCAPARSYVSVERITQALGLPKPSVVMPGAGSMPDPRGAMASYPGNFSSSQSGQQPQQFSSSQSGQQPQQFSSSQNGQQPQQFSSSQNGPRFSPQGGTQMLGSQTGGAQAWGNTAGDAPKSKTGLIIGLSAAAVVLIGAIAGLGVFMKHRSDATATDPPKTETTVTAPTDTKTADPPHVDPSATAKVDTTPSASVATTAIPPPSANNAGNANANNANNAGHTGHTGHSGATTTTTTTTTTVTQPPTTATPHPTATAFDPLSLGRHGN
jgi:serine/threonine-protein kinase